MSKLAFRCQLTEVVQDEMDEAEYVAGWFFPAGNAQLIQAAMQFLAQNSDADCVVLRGAWISGQWREEIEPHWTRHALDRPTKPAHLKIYGDGFYIVVFNNDYSENRFGAFASEYLDMFPEERSDS